MKEILKGLFKIKNKIHLGSLFLISVLCLIPCFSYAGFTNSYLHSFYFSPRESNLNIQNYYTLPALDNKVCLLSPNSDCEFSLSYQGSTIALHYGDLYCYDNSYPMVVSNTTSYRCPISILFNNISLAEYFNPPYTSSDCQTEYNLIPISSVDSNYCQTNNLCPTCPTCPTCPSGSGDVSWSSLYINDIQHLGGPNINITIPQEISRDYEYDSNDDFNLDVEGYNVDYDYMDSIVSSQTYTPDSEDFTSIITNVIPKFVPGLVIILFIYFIFRFIKKIF